MRIEGEGRKGGRNTLSRTRAVFLDRDGTINEDKGYLSDVRNLKIVPGAMEAVNLLKREGFLIFIVSNQSGLARGFFTREDLERIHAQLKKIFPLDGIYYCPHHPDEDCPCRKPRPKMVLDIADKFRIDRGKSYVIGDAQSDLEMGQRAGCKSILVLTGKGKETEASLAGSSLPVEFIARDILGAVRWIVKTDCKGDFGCPAGRGRG
ncbi:HAD family hydrolase [candidate division NPL-UPA2 bacterium]|nr:HAD family hydrolase [candidate division NPL-UPA2 bacterium]